MDQLVTGASQHRRNRAIVVAGLVVATLVVAYALQRLFIRPGQSALRYISADAVGVVSIDFDPAPSQVLAFKSIENGLKDHNWDRTFKDAIQQMLGKGTAVSELSALLQPGASACIEQWNNNPGGSIPGYVVIGLTDGNQASSILSKSGQSLDYQGAKYYKNGPVLAMVLDNFLVLAGDPKYLVKAKQVGNGDAPSIETAPDFIEARKHVSKDSNLFCFVSHNAVAGLGKQVADAAPDWMAFALYIENGGLGFEGASKANFDKNPEARALSEAPGVRNDLFEVLPAGAYGVFASSDPALAAKLGTDSVKKQQAYSKGFVDFENSVNKAIGVDFEKDVEGGFTGNSILAFYPSQSPNAKGLDLLLVVDDRNGADPGHLFTRVEAFLEDQAAKATPKSTIFQTVKVDGGQEYLLDGAFKQAKLKGAGGPTANQSATDPDSWQNKTLAVAVVGKAVLIATSKDLLDRSMASYNSKQAVLKTDANFAPYNNFMNDGSQSLGICSLSRIVQGVQNSTATSSWLGPKFRTFLDAMSRLKDPLVFKGKISPDGIGVCTTFVPMDYNALMESIGNAPPTQTNPGVQSVTMR